MDMKKVLISGSVERFHNAVGISNQHVSSHSWGVAMLCQHFDPDCSKELIMAALSHDCAEMFTGDIPANTKWELPELKKLLDKYEDKILLDLGLSFELTDEEKILLKICDILEGMQYCLGRMQMGERGARRPFWAWYEVCILRYTLSDSQVDFLSKLHHKMRMIS